jgi:uncharacterized protein YkwD
LQFWGSINDERVLAGKPRLRLDPELSRSAAEHTKEMAAGGVLNHTTSDAMKKRITDWQLLGENVGVGGAVSSLHVAFMNSPAHRANILNDYKYVGIGTKVDGGRLWVTVIFESYSDPGTTLPMPSC